VKFKQLLGTSDFRHVTLFVI